MLVALALSIRLDTSYLDALPLENVVETTVVPFAEPEALLIELPPGTDVEFVTVVIWEDVVLLLWKLPKNETRLPSTVDFGNFHV